MSCFPTADEAPGWDLVGLLERLPEWAWQRLLRWAGVTEADLHDLFTDGGEAG